MAGCFGGSAEYRHFERQLMDHLDDSHHPCCACHEDKEEEWEIGEDVDPIVPECTCDEEYASDKADEQLSRMDF